MADDLASIFNDNPGGGVPPPMNPAKLAATLGMQANNAPTPSIPPVDEASIPPALLSMGGGGMDSSLNKLLQGKAQTIVPQALKASADQAKVEAEAAKSEALADQEYREKIAELYKNYKPDTVDFGGKPNAPEENPLKQFGSLASMLGIFASSFTKQPIVNALNASSSAMNAARANDMEAYHNSYKAWQDGIKNTIEKAKLDHGALEDALDIAKTDHGLALAKIKAYAAEKNWPAAAILAQTGDLEEIAKLAKSLDTASGKMGNFKSFILNEGVQEFIAKNGRPPSFEELTDINSKAEGKTKGGNLTEDGIAEQVGRYLGGDKTAISAAGYSPKDREAILNGIAEARKHGITPEIQAGIDQVKKEMKFAGGTSYERSLGTQAASVATASESVGGAADLLKEASTKLDRTKYPNINAIELAIKQGTGDENVAAFDIALDSLATERARALNPKGVPREGDIESARRVLSRNMGDKPLKAAVNQIIKETENIKASVARTREGAEDGAVKTVKAPPVSKLKEGVHTTFSNGQTWTLEDGEPVQVQ